MFYLKNFKNFDHADLDDERPVTLLVGPNGAGKSNIIEAVELLSFLAAGHPLHEVTDLGREGGLEVRGGLDACASFGHDNFTLGHRSNISTHEGLREVDYQISVRVGNEPRIISESLRIEGRKYPVFEVKPIRLGASADNWVEYDEHNPRARKKHPSFAAADRSALSQYARFAWRDKKLQETLQIVDAVLSALDSPAVFDPIPKLMRNYERDTEGRLARNGFNISPVLYQLHRTRDRPMRELPTIDFTSQETAGDDSATPILQRIAQLPDEPFQGFDFITTDAGDVMFGFKIPHSDKPITARVLSDGTLRALGILTALETSPKGTHLVLEELDNGVHPSRVHLLSEALFDCAERHGLHVLATTQNPATLNALTAEQLDGVLLVVPDVAKKFARLLPIKELPGYIEFVEQGRLGDLITRRVYERHLVADYEGERKKDIEEWLEALP
jgi:predicted ATPase